MSIRLLFILLLFPFFGLCQSVTVGTASPFNFSNNIYGPMYTTANLDSAYSRQAFIYPNSVLTGLKHGDTITSLEFYAEIEQAMVGQPELKIFLKMAKNDTFPSGNLHWTNEAYSSGSILVYNGDPTDIVGGYTGYKNFIFNVNAFVFDTSGGKRHLEILFDYRQTVKQNTNIYWWYENGTTVTAFNNINQGKIINGSGSLVPDYTNTSDVRKPHIRINFPRYNNNLEIIKSYCLGKVPILAGVNDSIQVLVQNRGKKTVNSSTLFLEITGANKHKENIQVTSLKPWEQKVFTFGKYRPDSSGTDVIQIQLASDNFNDNNFDTLLRRVNYNVFSHADPFSNNLGGIGFSGETGDFVAKFYTDTGVYINQVAVDFSSAGRAFRLGIWDDDGKDNLPGKVLFMSDSLTSVGGTYILPVLPRVKIGGGFYVGIRQITRTNVSFSFQYEDPVRPNAFYFTAPMGNTDWTPFSPGFPYKFNIQPRIQVGNDVAPLSIEFPSKDQNIEYSKKDSIGPIARVINYGFNDQTTPFEVICRITSLSGIEEYRSVKKITLKSGQTDTVYFDTAYRLYNLGTHKISVTTKLPDDKIIDNDSVVQLFKVSIKHDIGADIMYAPEESFVYEYKKDTITPTVRINNYGTVDKTNFKITFRIRDSSNIIHTQTMSRSLNAGQQEIITFNKFVPVTIGDYIAECFTTYKDTIPFNDTVRHNITFQKSNDVGPKSIDIPLPTAVYTMGGFFFSRLLVTNYGNKTQDTAFKVNMIVYGTNGLEFFRDSLYTPLGGFSDYQVQFKRCNIPNVFGKYKVFYKTELIGDQEPSNDTLTGFFTVWPNRDIAVNKFILPAKDTVLAIENLPIKPVIQIKNFGTLTLTNTGPVILKIFDKSNLIYEDSAYAVGNLSFNSILNVQFKKDFSYQVSNNLSCLAYTRLNNDLIRKNDTFSIIKFRTSRHYDLALDTFSNFNNGHTFIFENAFFKPQFLVKNFGSLAYRQPYSVKIDLKKNGTLFISKTRYFDSLGRFATNSWFQDSLIHLKEVGNYELCAKIFSTLDQNQTNDSFCWHFNISKPYDISLDSLQLTDKNNNCYHNIKYQPRVKASNLGSNALKSTLIQFNIKQLSNIYWQSIRYVDLDSGQSKWIKFDSTLMFDFEGPAIANAISSLNIDNDKTNDTLNLAFAVSKVSSASAFVHPKYLIYPNPNSGEFTIEFEASPNIGFISIYNSLGKLIKTIDARSTNQKQVVNLEGVSGIYLLKIEKDGFVFSQRISVVK